ncbi:MAG: recombinase family protein [Bacteroidetes bacterium]|jgi:DNA invertase Pin-like site-specific DNA recombinase|nr:recombinase family protein [Bacteroidota bacterium]
MRVKYNRVSTLNQTGERFSLDKDDYDLVLFDRVSGKVKFSLRENGCRLMKLVEQDKVTEIVIEEFSRVGRNTGDVISTLEWFDEKGVNVVVRNLGIQSRPNGKRNPIWKMLSSVLSSIYEMELENIKERTQTGRMVYVQNGGKLGRPTNSSESNSKFLKKHKVLKIRELLERGLRYSEIQRIVGCSPNLIRKVKTIVSE